jgi:2-phospho-L-lactate/phosphoenolpyruvate guanylyltransferase
MDRVWAVVVARAANGAKSRLAGVLSPGERRVLSQAMLSDVLDVCLRSTSALVGAVAVVDDAARSSAVRSRAVLVDDPGAGDMNAAVAKGIEAARRRGATTVIVLPGDVPLISTADLEALISGAGASPRAVVVAPSRDGQGTNALLLRPPEVITPAFGPPSAGRHVQAGVQACARTRALADLGVARDVDTPEDLIALVDASVGPNTAEVLANLRSSRALSLT